MRNQASSAKLLAKRVAALPSNARPGPSPAFSLPDAVAAPGFAAYAAAAQSLFQSTVDAAEAEGAHWTAPVAVAVAVTAASRTALRREIAGMTLLEGFRGCSGQPRPGHFPQGA